MPAEVLTAPFALWAPSLPAASGQTGKYSTKWLFLWENAGSSAPIREQKAKGNYKCGFGVTAVSPTGWQQAPQHRASLLHVPISEPPDPIF